jgi:hypothetical protein
MERNITSYRTDRMGPYNNDGIKEKRPREALAKACRLRKLQYFELMVAG